VGANEKVRQRRCFSAASFSIFQEAFPRKKLMDSGLFRTGCQVRSFPLIRGYYAANSHCSVPVRKKRNDGAGDCSGIMLCPQGYFHFLNGLIWRTSEKAKSWNHQYGTNMGKQPINYSYSIKYMLISMFARVDTDTAIRQKSKSEGGKRKTLWRCSQFPSSPFLLPSPFPLPSACPLSIVQSTLNPM